MAFDYGYGELGNQLISLFHSGPPDYTAAEELLRQGADLNAAGRDDCENIRKISLENHTTVEEVEAEMKVALEAAYHTPTFIAIFGGNIPTPEEFIWAVAQRIIILQNAQNGCIESNVSKDEDTSIHGI